MAEQNNATPNTPDVWHQNTQVLRDMVNDLYNGTFAMRKRIGRYLPRAEREPDDVYNARVLRTFLFPAYQETIDSLVGRVFSENPTVEGVSSLIELMLENVDMCGNDFSRFCRETFKKSEIDGLSAIHIDHTSNPENVTLADDEINPKRPYLRLICLDNLISVTLINDGGIIIVSEVRIRETVDVPDGEWGKKCIDQVRVLRPGMYAVYQEAENAQGGKDDDWVIVEQGVTLDSQGNLINEIPIVPIYTNKADNWQAIPPLLDLAGLNVEHFQVKSDLRTALHYCAVPLLALIGASKDEFKKITVASNSALILQNPNADVKWVELSGRSSEVNQNYLTQIEKQMDVLSMQPLIDKQSVKMTATEALIDQDDEVSELEADAMDAEQAFTKAVRWMQRYINESPTAVVQLHGNFIIEKNVNERLKTLLEMVKLDKIPDEYFLKEVQKLGVLSDDADIELILEMLAADRMNALAQLEQDLLAREAELENQPDDEPDPEPDDEQGE